MRSFCSFGVGPLLDCIDCYDFQDCVDVDECEKNVDTCDHQSKCENTDGSYKCVCQDGYQTVEAILTTDRDQCIDINECVDTGDHSGTIVHSCWADSTCVNSGKRLNGVFQNVPTRVIHFSWDIFL